MIQEKELKEIRQFLEKAERPLFFFDDDPDGLTSYLLLRKKYDKGHGVCVKAAPTTETIYMRKIEEHRPDLVVVLDRALLSQELIDKVSVPIVWIDHHAPVKREGVHYYNPLTNGGKNNKPTSYWAYRVVKENEWIAVIGIIGDWHVPDKTILKKFKYNELVKGAKTPPEFLFATPYGELVKMLSFSMKGTTTSTKECINALLTINDPLEILEQTTKAGKLIYEKYEKYNKGYKVLLEEALAQKEQGDVFVFTYSGVLTSYTGPLADELGYLIKQDVLIIGREKEGQIRMSLRSKGKPIRPILQKALEHVEGHGGGHPLSCGAAVNVHDFPKFVEIIKKEYKKTKY